MTTRTLAVSADLSGERVDKVLSTMLGISRALSREILDAGGVVSGERSLRASDRLAGGSLVVVTIPQVESTLIADPDVAFAVVHEDVDLLIVDKPVGVVVHPTSDRSKGTLVHGLLARYPDIRGVGQEGRWGIVHRLDRDTSGLLVVARTDDTYRTLVDMMKRREVTRRYLAMVIGSFDNTTGTVEAPIGRDPNHPTRMRLDRSGKPARTHYRRLSAWSRPDRTLLSVTLDTGRTHQIRVHMQAIERPIVGDLAYGRSPTVDSPGRPWLHARELSFVHPTTGNLVDVRSNLPQDLSDSLVSLGAPTVGDAHDVDGAPL